MVDIFSLAVMVTMSIAHPYSFVCYKFMVSNVNLVKYHGCNDSDALTYTSVKDYSFGDSDLRPYIHTVVSPYESPLQHQLIYSSILTP